MSCRPALPGPTNVSLRETLGRTLPDFMVPSTFVALGALPRTTAGKIDREALPAPGRPYRDPSRPLTPPRTTLEATIADIWREVMGQDAIDVHEHFYDLGGESLQALRIMARVRKTFGVDLDLQSLLDAPTVAEMAHTVAALGTKMPPGPSPTPGATVRGAILPLAPVQVPVWHHCQQAGPDAYVLDYAYDLAGPLDIEALTRTLSEIVRRHEILRTAYAVVDGTPVQVVGPAEPAQLIVVDASPSPGRGVAGEAPVPELELAQGRILRAVVTRLGVAEHRLRFSAHHLAMDGRSRDILAAELSALYGAFTREQPPRSPSFRSSTATTPSGTTAGSPPRARLIAVISRTGRGGWRSHRSLSSCHSGAAIRRPRDPRRAWKAGLTWPSSGGMSRLSRGRSASRHSWPSSALSRPSCTTPRAGAT